MLTLDKIGVHYGTIESLKNVSVHVEMGKLVGIIGPNGAGKSTLLKAMVNIVEHSGQVLYENKPLKNQLFKVAYVEQRSRVDLNFPITVREFVSLGTYYGKGLMTRISDEQWQLIDSAIEKVQLTAEKKYAINQLSGGQFQRMMLARALVQQPDILLLDEPLAGVDKVSENFIMTLLKELRDEGKLVMMVHHDLSTVKAYFEELLLINKTLVKSGLTQDVYTQENILETYGVQVEVTA